MSALDELLRERVVFVGSVLGPLYLNDPKLDADKATPLLEAFAGLDEHAADEWPFGGDEAAPYLDEMRQAAAMSFAGDRDALMWEYRRLFVGPGGMPVPPWGSVYTDRECVVFGASTLALRQWMRERGIERLGTEADPEDHIGYLLLLMAWIAEHQPEFLREFMEQHLLTWSAHFLKQLEEAAEHPFYRGLAGLTRVSLDGIGEAIGAQVVFPRYYR